MTAPEFLAVDWGTTNRRVYAIAADGAVIDTERDDRGVLAIGRDGLASEVAGLRARWGDAPMLLAGMVGSTRGWSEVPYQACPVDLDALAAGLVEVAPGIAIVPGVSVAIGGRGDVMRGEEVQLLGAVAAGLAPPDAVLCQPGTHCKWADMRGGAIADFRTTMTGELFALLRKHSLLADFLDGEVVDGPAFQAGLKAAQQGALLRDLFGERASVLLGLRERGDVAAHVSGLLVGSDVREQKLSPNTSVHILADASLGALYLAAVSATGTAARVVDSHAAFVAGITAIWRRRDVQFV